MVIMCFWISLKSVILYHIFLFRARHGVVAEGLALGWSDCRVWYHVLCGHGQGAWSCFASTFALHLGNRSSALSMVRLISDGKAVRYRADVGTQRCRKMGQRSKEEILSYKWRSEVFNLAHTTGQEDGREAFRCRAHMLFGVLTGQG